VRVVDDVIKAGHSLRGRVGRVLETWEKCDVDPTCCCAEQVDPNMAVRVEFRGTESDPSGGESSFTHFFAEGELVKLPDQLEAESAVSGDSVDKSDVPFDGMSCVAFKLDQLNVDEKPRRIASFEPSRPTDE